MCNALAAFVTTQETSHQCVGQFVHSRIDLQVLNIVNQDSGALGPLGMVVHKFSELGVYHVAVQRQGRCVGRTAFEVDPAGERQIEIHLTAIMRHSLFPSDAPKVVPNGFVLFHASAGDGYSATVAADGEKPIFDSSHLRDGDLYATSLLEPGRYKLVNAAGTAKAEIVVTATSRDAEPIYVDVNSKSFAPSAIRVTSSQGLVFRVRQPARVVITRHRSAPEGKTVLQWRDTFEAE